MEGAAEAARMLFQCWQAGERLAALPEPIRPQSRADGYAIQAELAAISGDVVAGWKIAATSAAGQAHINVDGPLAGRIFASRIRGAGAILSLRGNAMRVAELEFAFRFRRALEPREWPYEVADVLEAVGTMHLALEAPDSRFERFERAGSAQLLADDACAHEFLLGEPVSADWRAIDLSRHPVRGQIVGGTRCEGGGQNVLGDPRVALAWLVNELSGLGLTLEEGMVVSTGTCVKPLPLAPGDHVIGDFGVLGRIEAQFED